MRIGLAAIVSISAAFACGCTSTVRTSPDNVEIGSGAFSSLPPRTVALVNGYPSEAPLKLSTAPYTLIAEQKHMTDTAIEALRRGFEKNLPPRGKGQGKKVILKVHSPRTSSPYPAPGVAVTVDAQFGDGTRTAVNGEGYSGRGADRSFEVAIVNALNRLLADPRFVAYMKR
jgi:hypothetical protein